MKLSSKVIAVSILAVNLFTTRTTAATITFNSAAPFGGEAFFSGTYSEAGYNITSAGGAMYFINHESYFPGVMPFDGAVLEFNSFSGSFFTLTQSGGGAFDLTSVMTGS